MPFPQHLQGFGIITLLSEEETKAAVGFGVVGLEPDRGAVFGDGLVALALGRQGVAEVVVGFGVVGLEPDRLAEGGLRGGVVVLDVAQDGAEVEVGLGVVGLEPDRLAGCDRGGFVRKVGLP